MASTVLVKDVLWSASVLLQDIVPQFQRHPESELVDWLNDGQVALTKFLPPACTRIVSVRLKPGTRQSIEAIAPADCKLEDGSAASETIYGTQVVDVFRNMGASGTTPGRVVRRTERKVLDTQSPNWHSVVGTEVSSFMYDPAMPRSLLVTPGVPTDRLWMELAITAQPHRIPAGGDPGAELYKKDGTSTTVISINDEHRDDLVNYVVARANMKPADWANADKAQAFSAMFLNSLNAKVTALTGVSPNLKALPLAENSIGRGAQ